MKKLALSALFALLTVCSAVADILGVQFALQSSIGAPNGPMSGYVIGDVVTLSCADVNFLTAPKLLITAVNVSGAATGVSVINPGLANGSPVSTTARCQQSATTGSGAGLNITASIGVQSVASFVDQMNFPGYIVGNWYAPFGYGNTATGPASVANRVYCYPGYIKQKVTIGSLGGRIIAGAAGNVQFSVYYNNPLTGRPAGATPITSTASMSTASAGPISSAAVGQAEPGLYWFCGNTDTAALTFTTQTTGTAGLMTSLIGSATQGNVFGGGSGSLTGVFTAQTFGTWPNMNLASFTEIAASAAPFGVLFQVQSAP